MIATLLISGLQGTGRKRASMKKLLILGAGGHARVVSEIAVLSGWQVEGFLDDKEEIQELAGYPVLGKIEKAVNLQQNHTLFLAIGNNQIRKKLSHQFNRAVFATLIHPSAVVSGSAVIKPGSVLMANTVINAGAEIGEHCIINTGSVVEHDDMIGSYVHISPGCRLGGGVSIGDDSWLGIGSCVKDHIRICPGCVTGAGAVVVKNINEIGTYVGVPAVRTDKKRLP